MLRPLLKIVVAIAFLLLVTQTHVNATPPAQKNGTLEAFITWGDVENTPATGVYVEAHGYVASAETDKSFVFKMLKAGRYEVSLPSGVYDVFISDGSSIPRCRRMRVTSGKVSTWTVKLELDEVYTEH